MREYVYVCVKKKRNKIVFNIGLVIVIVTLGNEIIKCTVLRRDKM